MVDEGNLFVRHLIEFLSDNQYFSIVYSHTNTSENIIKDDLRLQ